MMLKWIIIAVLAVGVWQWWGKVAVQQYQAQQGKISDIPKSSVRFRCDGRTHCSQMALSNFLFSWNPALDGGSFKQEGRNPFCFRATHRATLYVSSCVLKHVRKPHFFCNIVPTLKWMVIVMGCCVKNNGVSVKLIGQFMMNCPVI